MSFANGNYNGELYIGHVKWSNDYKHVVAFTDDNTGDFSATKRETFLKSHLNKVDNPICAVSSLNGYIDVDGKLKNLETANYLMFKNDDDFSDTYFYCFVTDFQIIAQRTTRLYIQLDVFQQYFYNTTFYRSFIERGHISKAQDNSNYYKYVTPEPIGFNAEIETEISIFSEANFEPIFVIDTLSEPIVKELTPDSAPEPGIPYLCKFNYGGNGVAEECTGIYRWLINSQTDITTLIMCFSATDARYSNINHYSDILGVYFIPTWVKDRATWRNNPIATFLQCLAKNNNVPLSGSVSVGGPTLGNGYTPTNKKMLNSLARAYKIFNRNGLTIPINPELLSDRNSITIELSMKPLGNTYKLTVVGYKDVSSRNIDLPYNYSLMFGINSNTGVAQASNLQQLNLQSAVIKQEQINAGITAGQNLISGTVGNMLNMGSAASPTDLINGGVNIANGLVNYYKDISSQIAKNKLTDFNQTVLEGNALASISKSIGNSCDTTNMYGPFQKIRLAECNPSLENCAIIDDFLTAYGYKIDEIVNIDDFLNTRPVFNFVKTNGINLNAQCPAVYENILKDIFNNGVTMWKKYAQFGNYLINNW